MSLPATTGRGVCRARTCCPQSTAAAHGRRHNDRPPGSTRARSGIRRLAARVVYGRCPMTIGQILFAIITGLAVNSREESRSPRRNQQIKRENKPSQCAFASGAPPTHARPRAVASYADGGSRRTGTRRWAIPHLSGWTSAVGACSSWVSPRAAPRMAATRMSSTSRAGDAGGAGTWPHAEYGEYRTFGDESWTVEMDDLFDRAGAAGGTRP